jgi:hypothetical protein
MGRVFALPKATMKDRIPPKDRNEDLYALIGERLMLNEDIEPPMPWCCTPQGRNDACYCSGDCGKWREWHGISIDDEIPEHFLMEEPDEVIEAS